MSDVKKIEYDKHPIIIERYINGETLKSIAETYKVHLSAIDYILRKHNVPKRSNKINSRKYFYNENYFETIDTKEKAYWLGFIYADGYIRSNKDGTNKMFGIALSIDDKEHLEKLKKSLNATYLIKDYTPNSNSYSNKKYSRLQIFGDKIYNDLKSHGVFPNKTLILKSPKIETKLYSHFIRGYIDGDGCITSHRKSKKKSSKKDFAVKIVGTKELLDFIKNFIESNNIATIRKYYKRRNNSKVFSLELTGNLQVKAFLNLIYKDAQIYLNRKYERYIELSNMYNS